MMKEQGDLLREGKDNTFRFEDHATYKYIYTEKLKGLRT